MFRQEDFAEVREDPPVKGQTAPDAGWSTHPPGGREDVWPEPAVGQCRVIRMWCGGVGVLLNAERGPWPSLHSQTDSGGGLRDPEGVARGQRRGRHR